METDERGGVPVSQAEAERSIVRRLTAFAVRDPNRWYPSANGKDLCYWCGLGPRRPNLCDDCEALRQRLLVKYPDERRNDKRTFATRADADMTPLSSVKTPEWMPFRESE